MKICERCGGQMLPQSDMYGDSMNCAQCGEVEYGKTITDEELAGMPRNCSSLVAHNTLRLARATYYND